MFAQRAGLFATIAAALAVSACTSSAGPTQVVPSRGGALPFVADLILNGSFEQPTAPTGGFLQFSTGQTFSHWKVAGASGNVDLIGAGFGQNGFSFPAKCGVQFLDLTGESQSATGVVQNVATKAGSHHTLTFEVGNVVDQTGPFGTSSTVKVKVNGAAVFSATNSRGAGLMHIVWQKFSVQITAPSTTTKILFLNGDPPNDTANGLDCVKLT